MEHKIGYIIAIFLSLSTLFASDIAERIYQNECGSNPQKLIHQNRGENFFSLGIGHFIWYPEGVHERFEESFPKLIAYLQTKGYQTPKWLTPNTKAPWRDINSAKRDKRYYELMDLLLNSFDMQMDFMVDRFKNFTENSPTLSKKIEKILELKNGEFMLVDYLNFKGSGLNKNERYGEEGWGLKQVLECMRDGYITQDEFIRCAKEVLRKRVKNSPKKRGEKRWLKGWFNRIDSYKEYR
jgi:hypothetical protein